MTSGEWHAWRLIKIATGIEFGILGLFWLLAYIKRPDMQRIYYRAIAWVIPISWFFAFWALIAFIVGGTQWGGDLGWDIGYWLFYVIFEGAFQALAWWLATSGAIKYYRWEQQEWWNYNKEDSPHNWPKQLGEFVDY